MDLTPSQLTVSNTRARTLNTQLLSCLHAPGRFRDDRGQEQQLIVDQGAKRSTAGPLRSIETH